MSSTTPRTATTRVVTEINRTAVVDALREHGPLSRKQLMTLTGLSSATVERISRALLSAGSIVIDGREQSSGGRPSFLLRYSGASQLVIAAEVGDAGAVGLLVDLDGVTVAEHSVTFPTANGSGASLGSARLDGTLTLIDRLLADAEAAGRPCLGIGISVPGIVHAGKVMNTAALGWRDVPLISILEDRTGLPVLVENDANAIAFGEAISGVAAGSQSVVSYVLGVGVGSGIVTDGAIHHGARSAAGEVGFLFADRGALGSYFTEQGDLELRIAEVTEAPASDRAESVRALLLAAAAGDPAAAARTADLFDLVAFSCGAITTVVDPEVIVLAGHLAAAPDYAIEQISRRLVGRIPFPPRLTVGTLGDRAALEGVRHLITRHVRRATYLS